MTTSATVAEPGGVAARLDPDSLYVAVSLCDEINKEK